MRAAAAAVLGGLASAADASIYIDDVHTAGRHKKPLPEEAQLPPGEYAALLAGAAALVVVGGLAAGLTLGLLSIDDTQMRVLLRSGDARQRRLAARVAPLRRHMHLLLVTLLLTNVAVNEALPVLLHTLNFDGIVAVAISTSLVVVFGEIIPQAVCARHGLAVGAAMAYPVKVLMWLLFPISYPIARLLDLILGRSHGTSYRRAELKELVLLHSEIGDLSRDEVGILKSVLEVAEKQARHIYTSLDNVFMLPSSGRLDHETRKRIITAGHSRIPVYHVHPQQILGVLLVKTLILIDPNEATPLSKIKLRRLPVVGASTNLFQLLHIFERGGSHMAIVVEDMPEAVAEAEPQRDRQQREEQADNTQQGPLVRPQASLSSSLNSVTSFLSVGEQGRMPTTVSHRPHNNDCHPHKDSQALNSTGLTTVTRVLPDEERTCESALQNHQHRAWHVNHTSINIRPASNTPPPEQPFPQESHIGQSSATEQLPTPKLIDLSGTNSTVPSPGVPPQRVLGIVTLEDVIEEVIGEEIVDETDEYEDVNRKIKAVRVFEHFAKRASFPSRGVTVGAAAAAAASSANLSANPSKTTLMSLFTSPSNAASQPGSARTSQSGSAVNLFAGRGPSSKRGRSFYADGDDYGDDDDGDSIDNSYTEREPLITSANDGAQHKRSPLLGAVQTIAREAASGAGSTTTSAPGTPRLSSQQGAGGGQRKKRVRPFKEDVHPEDALTQGLGLGLVTISGTPRHGSMSAVPEPASATIGKDVDRGHMKGVPRIRVSDGSDDPPQQDTV